MAFTKSLLIKALGGIAGVGGTTVGVLVGTGVFNKKDLKVPANDAPPGNNNAVPGSQDSKGEGNESVDSTNPGVGSEVGNKAGQVATEQQPKQVGQTDDRSQQSDSGLQDGQPGRDNAGSTTTGSHDTPGSASPNELGNVDNGEVGGGDEHRSDSASQISKPGTPANPEQGADDVDPKPQSTNPPNSQPSGEEQKSSGINTGVNEPQQSTPTLQEAPTGAPAGTAGGNSGGSNLPNVGSTPESTGDNGADGERSESQDSSTTNTVTQPQTEIEKANAKLRTLNIPDTFQFTDTNRTIQNSISKEELKKMKFDNGSSAMENAEMENLKENIQLKIEILSENKKTAYGLNDDGEENNLLFTLSGFKNSIEITHGGSSIYPNTNPEFKAEGDGLKLVWDQAVNLAEKVGIKSNNGSYSLDKNTTTLKYSLDSGTTINTLSSPNASGTIRVEVDKENYNQGVKVTFGGKVTGTGSDSLEKGDYEIKYKDGENEGWYLSKKNEGTDGQQKGIQGAGGGRVDNPNQPPQPDGSHSSSGLSSEQQLDNNQQDQVPTEDTDSLPRTDVSESTQTITENQNSRVNDVSDTVDNEGDAATDPQVKATNSKL